MKTSKPKKLTKPKITTAHAYNDRMNALQMEITRLRHLNTDMDQQIRDVLKNKQVTPAELEEFTRLRQQHITLNKFQNDLVIYMRNNLPEKLAGGDLTTIFINCLTKYKALLQAESERKAKIQ